MTDDIFKEFEEEADKSQDVDLGFLSRLVERQEMLEGPEDEDRAEELYQSVKEEPVATIELLLKKKKADLQKVRTQDIPETMEQFGISSFTTANGLSINVKRDVNVTVLDVSGFLNYLRQEGLDAIIKNEITLKSFDREEVVSFLEEHKYDFAEKEGVHPQTLSKFVRDRMEAGQQIPDSLKVYEFSIAKIKRSKK